MSTGAVAGLKEVPRSNCRHKAEAIDYFEWNL